MASSPTTEPASPAATDTATATATTAPTATATATATTTTTTTTTPVTEGELAVPPLSKNKLKKLARQKRFEETRAEWKAAKREKAKARKLRKREEREEREAAAMAALAGGKRKSPSGGGEGAAEDSDGAKRRRKEAAQPVAKVVEDIALIVDCGFDELMTDKEVNSMAAQLMRSYSANKASPRQFEMHVTSLSGRLLARYRDVLKNQHLRWKGMAFSHEPYAAVTAQEKASLVYLTADSEHTIHELEPGKKYIIGGIVDRNRHKNLCFEKAKMQGIAHGRLPIGDYIKMASRQVLTTNQVVEIMLEWLNQRDWEKAFVKVIPQRKLWALKGKKGKKGKKSQDGSGGDANAQDTGEDEGEDGEQDTGEDDGEGGEQGTGMGEGEDGEQEANDTEEDTYRPVVYIHN